MSQTFVLRVLEVRPQGTIGDPIILAGFGDVREILAVHSPGNRPYRVEDAIEVYSEEVTSPPLVTALNSADGDHTELYFMSVAALYGYQASERHRLQKEVPVDVK